MHVCAHIRVRRGRDPCWTRPGSLLDGIKVTATSPTTATPLAQTCWLKLIGDNIAGVTNSNFVTSVQ